MKQLRCLLVLFLLLSLASSMASALTIVGDTWIGNSWGQRFEQGAELPFDCMRIDWVHGSVFELPTAFENFSDENWMTSYEIPVLASARGSDVNTLGFDIIFDGDLQPTAFTFTTYRDNAAQDYFRAEYTEGPLTSVWIITPGSGDPPAPPPLSDVPEPVTLLLLGTGLLTAGATRLRLRKSAGR